MDPGEAQRKLKELQGRSEKIFEQIQDLARKQQRSPQEHRTLGNLRDALRQVMKDTDELLEAMSLHNIALEDQIKAAEEDKEE